MDLSFLEWLVENSADNPPGVKWSYGGVDIDQLREQLDEQQVHCPDCGHVLDLEDGQLDLFND